MNRRTFFTTAVAVAVLLSATALPHQASATTVTDSTVRTHGPVVLIGDSLSGGNIPAMRKMLVANEVGPFRLDIKGGRSITHTYGKKPSGLAAIASIRKSGFEPKAWVIALGGNDLGGYRWQPSKRDPLVDIRKVMDLLGPDAQVAWPTIARKYKQWWPVAQKFNDALHAAAVEYPNLHVIEWADLLNQHNPGWFFDNAHLRGKGVTARNQMTVDAMILVADAAHPS